MSRLPVALCIAVVAASAAGCVGGGGNAGTPGASSDGASVGSIPAATHEMKRVTPSADYPLKTCVVTGDELGERPIAYTCDGVEVQFCCPDCIGDFKKDPETFLAKIRAAKK